MQTFDHVLNWKLKRGSHRFPGKDGGTCINEAAIVAAGFEYQAIDSVDQMPDCFSRPICRLAMLLNDEACDEDRQRLLSFVTRLACADTPEVERARADYINRNVGRHYGHLPFDKGLEILEGALGIGRRADLQLDAHAVGRMHVLQAGAVSETSVASTPTYKHLLGWLAV
jgi:hypothetical protein